MPDPAFTYARLAARSRIAADDLARRTLVELHREYAALLVRLTDSGSTEALTADRAASLATSVRRLLARLARQMAATTGDGAAQAVRLAPAAHAQALTAAADVAGVSVSVSFAEVPRRAVEALMSRRQLAATYGRDSYTGVLQTIMERATEGLGPEIDRLLTSQVARGVSVDRATTEMAAALARGDDELLRAVQRLGPRGGLRRTLQQVGAEVSEDALTEGRRLMGKARRLARTEIITAHREADRLSAGVSPAVRAVRWSLSGNHPISDCCDLYAVQDLHGLGAGLYHPGTAPSNPHPHCRCYLLFELRPPSEWSTPRPRPTAPRAPDRDAAEALFAGQTEGYVSRQVEIARRGLAVAFEERP